MKQILKLPINIDSKNSHFFKKKCHHSFENTKVKELHNVFVSHEGLCLKNGFLVGKSTFNMLPFKDKSFYYENWKLAMEQYIVSKWGKSLEMIYLDEQKYYGIIHTKWFNYSFWINSSLIRLIRLLQFKKEFTLIFPENWKYIKYVMDTLSAFPTVKYLEIPKGKHLFIKNLLLPTVRAYTASFNPDELTEIRMFVEKETPCRKFVKDFPNRIYLSREKVNLRKIINQEEISHILKKYNFYIINFEDYTFWEQAAIMEQAKYFIANNGAGMSNMMFMKPGAKVLEMVNRKYAENEYTFPFWKMGVLSRLDYYIQFGVVASNSNKLINSKNKIKFKYSEFLVNQDIYINPLEFEKNINIMLKK